MIHTPHTVSQKCNSATAAIISEVTANTTRAFSVVGKYLFVILASGANQTSYPFFCKVQSHIALHHASREESQDR